MSFPICGVIEGFYGREWSWAARRDYACFLRNAGYQWYIYAPKSDLYLRRHWQQRWPDDHFASLQQLRDCYLDQGVEWGLGFSPFGLQQQWTDSSRRELRDKLRQIKVLRPDILGILFDDMRGDIDGLAALQSEIVAEVMASDVARRYILCPTYYSFDPVLEQLFGQRPEQYWQDLGHMLDPEVGIFWTGDYVCSTAYSPESLAGITAQLGRKPLLWDNYPVNDGRVSSRFLHLYAYTGRPASIAASIEAHVVNPMNLPELSKLPLLTLPANYRLGESYEPQQAFVTGMEELGYSDAFRQALVQDWTCFQQQGLDLMGDAVSKALQAKYATFDDPAAAEIHAWLRGDYQFDPACLTS